MRNGSIEGIELKCPVVIESRALRQDSGGAGKYRGGLGLDVRVRNLVEGRWNFEHTRRSKCPPWGVWGGGAGEPGGYLLRLPKDKNFQFKLRRTHSRACRVAGGGADRRRRRLGRSAPARSRAGLRGRRRRPDLGGGARRLYGVAVRGHMSLDESATKRLRDRLRSARKARSAPKKTKTKSAGKPKGRKR